MCGGGGGRNGGEGGANIFRVYLRKCHIYSNEFIIISIDFQPFMIYSSENCAGVFVSVGRRDLSDIFNSYLCHIGMI